MQSIKKIINNKDFEFINESWSSSSSWGHRTVLLYAGYEIAEKKIKYLNRTWESYEFQSCMKCAVDLAIEKRKADLKESYKIINKIGRFTKKTAAEFKKRLDADQFIKTLEELKSQL